MIQTNSTKLHYRSPAHVKLASIKESGMNLRHAGSAIRLRANQWASIQSWTLPLAMRVIFSSG